MGTERVVSQGARRLQCVWSTSTSTSTSMTVFGHDFTIFTRLCFMSCTYVFMNSPRLGSHLVLSSPHRHPHHHLDRELGCSHRTTAYYREWSALLPMASCCRLRSGPSAAQYMPKSDRIPGRIRRARSGTGATTLPSYFGLYLSFQILLMTLAHTVLLICHAAPRHARKTLRAVFFLARMQLPWPYPFTGLQLEAACEAGTVCPQMQVCSCMMHRCAGLSRIARGERTWTQPWGAQDQMTREGPGREKGSVEYVPTVADDGFVVLFFCQPEILRRSELRTRVSRLDFVHLTYPRQAELMPEMRGGWPYWPPDRVTAQDPAWSHDVMLALGQSSVGAG